MPTKIPAETLQKGPTPEYTKKLLDKHILFEEDGELKVVPGVVPADTVKHEIEQGVYHAGS